MNYKQYLLDLLDGSQSLSHEGIGMALDYISRLEAVAVAAQDVSSLFTGPGTTAHTWGNALLKLGHALAALGGGKE